MPMELVSRTPGVTGVGAGVDAEGTDSGDAPGFGLQPTMTQEKNPAAIQDERRLLFIVSFVSSDGMDVIEIMTDLRVEVQP